MKKEEKKALVKLAKEALNSSEVCQDWKDKIYEAAPSLKPQLEVGKWYKGMYDDCREFLFYYLGNLDDDGDCMGYGFCDGEWSSEEAIFTNLDSLKKNKVNPATHEEVEKALIEEAKRRGFKKYGIYTINSASGFNNYNAFIEHDIFLDALNKLWLECGCVFNNGKWATIPEPTVTIGNKECTAEFLQQKLDELKNK